MTAVDPVPAAAELVPVCPSCRGAIAWTGATGACSACARRFGRLPDGSADMLGRDFWWQHLDPGTFDGLLERGEQHGWDRALREVVPAADFAMATERDRADWRVLLPPLENAVIADVGCFWGAITALLAPHARQVWAVDGTPHTVRFVNMRARQEGLTNVRTVRALAQELPFPDASLDGVVLNGVIEWVGLTPGTTDPYSLQDSVLAGIARVLKPGGFLYVATKNRFGINYLAGRRDQNTALRFITLLSRGLADRYCRLALGHPFLTPSYSCARMERVLRRVGFRTVNLYGILPDYRRPNFLVPMNDSAEVRRVMGVLARRPGEYSFNRGWARQALIWLAHACGGAAGARLLAPAFAAVAIR